MSNSFMETEMLAALKNCQRLFDEALPKFDWGNAFLDANAIILLNSVPLEVARVIKQMEQLKENKIHAEIQRDINQRQAQA